MYNKNMQIKYNGKDLIIIDQILINYKDILNNIKVNYKNNNDYILFILYNIIISIISIYLILLSMD